MKKVFLALIITLSTAIYFYRLPENPPGFFCDEASEGYDAYCLSRTLHDQHGAKLPVFLRALGDWRGGLFAYLCIPAVMIFGLSEFAVRATAAALGLIAIFCTYLLGKEFDSEETGILSALFLAASPWHFYLSRTGVGLVTFAPVFLLALYFFIRAVRGKRTRTSFLISGTLFSLGLYTYFSARLFVPLFVAILLIIYRKRLWEFRKSALIFLAALIVVSIPFERFYLRNRQEAMARYNALYRGSKPEVQKVLSAYVEYYSYRFLFKEGDRWRRSVVTGYGILHVFQLPFIILAVMLMLWRRSEGDKAFLAWLLLFPLPGALTQVAAVQRSNIGCPAFAILTGYGTYSFFAALYRGQGCKVTLPAKGWVVVAAVALLVVAQVILFNPASWIPWAARMTPVALRSSVERYTHYGMISLPILWAAVLSILGGVLIYSLARPCAPMLRESDRAAREGTTAVPSRRWATILMLAFSCAGEAVLLWRIRSGPYSAYWGLLWGAVLVSFCIVMHMIDRRCPAVPTRNFGRRDVIWALALSLGAMALYGIDLDSWRYTMIGDETVHYDTSKIILSGGMQAGLFSEDGVYGNMPAFCSYYEAFITLLGGGGFWGWRLSSALPVVASIGPFFLLLRLFAGRQAAIGAAVALATCPYVITFAHLGSPISEPIFPTVVSLLFILLCLGTGNSLYAALSGAVAGLGFYTYYASRVSAPLAVLAILMIRAPRLRRGGRLAVLGVFLAALGLTVAPLLVSASHKLVTDMLDQTVLRSINYPGAQHNLSDLRRITPAQIQGFWRNMSTMLLSPLYFEARSHFVWGKLLFPVSSSLCVVGLVALLCTIFTSSFSLYLIAIGLITQFVTGAVHFYPYPPTTRMLLDVLFLCVWIAWGFEAVMRAFPKSWPRAKNAVGMILICGIVGFNAWKQYVVIPYREYTHGPCPMVLKILQNTDRNVHVCYLNQPEYNFYNIEVFAGSMGYKDRLILMPTRDGSWQKRLSELTPPLIIVVNDMHPSREEINNYLMDTYSSQMVYERVFDPARRRYIDTYVWSSPACTKPSEGK